MDIKLSPTLRRREGSDATETRYLHLPPEAVHMREGDVVVAHGFNLYVADRYWFGLLGDDQKPRVVLTVAETETTWEEIDGVASGQGRDAEDAGGES